MGQAEGICNGDQKRRGPDSPKITVDTVDVELAASGVGGCVRDGDHMQNVKSRAGFNGAFRLLETHISTNSLP
jgi:hypothetical protein